MPRLPRLEIPNGVYHVNARAVDERTLVGDVRDWTMLLTLIGDAAAAGWLVHVYCALRTHYHLLVTTPAADLARGMWRINLRYARWFNRRYGLSGHVFGGRYHARLVADAQHGLEVSRYIPLNPVAAGLCSRPEEWPWSSYAATIGLVPVPSFLRPGVMLEQFGDGPLARRRYRQFVEDGLTRLSQVPGTGETAGTRYRRIRG